ncbi:MAG: hypothetical protein R3C03_00115 [Pirellulaceae bacterium]
MENAVAKSYCEKRGVRIVDRCRACVAQVQSRLSTTNATMLHSRELHPDYPAISPDVVLEVVGVSHFNLYCLKELVEPRPELAKAAWDWGFGD